MVNASYFWIAWLVYIVAASVYYLIFWRITRFQKRRVLKYSLRALMFTIIATPWYVSDTGTVMAPALIIVMMDAITISSEAAVRAFVPLFLSMSLSLVLVLLMLLVRRGKSQQADDPS